MSTYVGSKAISAHFLAGFTHIICVVAVTVIGSDYFFISILYLI